MSTPSRIICPEVGESRPASRPSSVLLPLPDAPMMATNCPRSTSRLMPLRISTVWVAVAIRLVSWRATIARWFDWFDIYPLYLLFWHRVTRYSLFAYLWAAISWGQQPADPRPVIVAFGDSLTAGYGLDTGYSYPDFLQKDLDRAGRKYRVVNAGVSGDTTSGGLARIGMVTALKPAIVILELGGNDGL